jgi:tRNA dimethylallyltransferase
LPPLLAIVGPTASGKTELGLHLAKEQNAEIISVDSRQVYQFLSVGTAKPLGKWDAAQGSELYVVDGVPYHLVDFLEPNQRFTAAEFVRRAERAVQDIRARRKTPMFVGGTGLYFKALTEGLAALPEADPALRARLKAEAGKKGREHLHKRLVRIDPEGAKKVPANNIQRLIRALEVYEVTGKPISLWHQEHKKEGLSLKFVGIDLGREELIKRIETRSRAMLENGMITETEHLLKQGFPETCPALSGLGYPRVVAFLKRKLSKEECLRLLVQDTRQYAKRQMTYFRHQLPVQWQAAGAASHPPPLEA